MYEAIVLLPLIGAIVAGAIALFGARNRFPGADPGPAHDDHAPLHAVSSESHTESGEEAPEAAGSLLAELVT